MLLTKKIKNIEMYYIPTKFGIQTGYLFDMVSNFVINMIKLNIIFNLVQFSFKLKFKPGTEGIPFDWFKLNGFTIFHQMAYFCGVINIELDFFFLL